MNDVLEIGDVVGDLCDSGLSIPKEISKNFKVLNFTEVNCKAADEVVKVILKAVGYDKYDGYCDKVAVIIATPDRNMAGEYVAVYSYDGYCLNFFTFVAKSEWYTPTVEIQGMAYKP